MKIGRRVIRKKGLRLGRYRKPLMRMRIVRFVLCGLIRKTWVIDNLSVSSQDCFKWDIQEFDSA
jgi:hypothetical protein